MGDVYKIIFETTRAIKPESVTQACPCGTPPSLAWLPFIDQAVTADPVGAVQVRRRIKMYKALLGPQSAVYGDHVELSEMTPRRARATGASTAPISRRRSEPAECRERNLCGPIPVRNIKPVALTDRERRALEEMDRPLQREDAVEGRIPRSLRLRV